MSGLHQVQIIGRPGPHSEIFLDGKPLLARAVSLRLDAASVPALTVEIPLGRIVADGKVRVVIDDETADLLTGLGWTAPEEQP